METWAYPGTKIESFTLGRLAGVDQATLTQEAKNLKIIQ